MAAVKRSRRVKFSVLLENGKEIFTNGIIKPDVDFVYTGLGAIKICEAQGFKMGLFPEAVISIVD